MSATNAAAAGLSGKAAPAVAVTVYGDPAPQGSKRHVGGGRMVESSKRVEPWREAVKLAALRAIGTDWTPLDTPLAVDVTFTLAKPASAPRRVTWPAKKPDIDKLGRAVLDALGHAGVYVDDARVVELNLVKCFPGEGVGALRTPGARITVWTIGGAA